MSEIGSHMSKVRHKLVVLSGKGGVGKSTVAANLAVILLKKGKKVGLLDIDLCGPSIPRLLGLQGRDVKKSSEGWVPVYMDDSKKLAVMSIGFLLPDPDAAVIWRGPKKTAMIRQFVDDVVWEDLDYLVIDTPPGTSDEHLAVVEALTAHNPDGAVLVTTPQMVAVEDVRREITFCTKAGLAVLGLLENMSGYVCPHCKECTNIFASEGGRMLAEEQGVPFLGTIPIDPVLCAAADAPTFEGKFPDSTSLQALDVFASNLIAQHDKH